MPGFTERGSAPAVHRFALHRARNDIVLVDSGWTRLTG
jgi:hypothetical protein